MFIFLAILYVIGCVALVAAILKQDKRNAGGMGSIAGMGQVSDTYWNKNKTRDIQGTLEKWTKIGAVILAILSVVLCLI